MKLGAKLKIVTWIVIDKQTTYKTKDKNGFAHKNIYDHSATLENV